MATSTREFGHLQDRLHTLLDSGYINIRALEREADLSNGSISRILAAKPDMWVRHANSNHDTPDALHKAMDRIVLSVAEAYRPQQESGEYPWP